MTLEEYCKNRNISVITSELIDKLKNYAEKDEEFIVGVLVDLKTDAERKQLVDYIDNGKDVSYENIILVALEISQKREKKGI